MKPFVRATLCGAGLIAIGLSAPAQQADPPAPLGLPPLMRGGIAGLGSREHAYIQERYGDYEPLNFSNAGRLPGAAAASDTGWKLVALGNFLDSTIQYATLAKLKDKPQGTLLIMFEWVDPRDTTRAHGVFYDTFLSRDRLLIRTKQASAGVIDTLMFSCADMKRACGVCYYDAGAGAMTLQMIDKD